MNFPNPVKRTVTPAPPPMDPGDFATVAISGSDAATFALENTEPGTVRNGNHFFYSGFQKASSVSTYAELDKKIVLLHDADIHVSLTLSFDANGRLSESPSSDNVVSFRAVTGGSLSSADNRQFFLASSVEESTINRRINYDAKGWLWVAIYYEHGNEASFRAYLNGVQLQEVGHTSDASEEATVTDSTFQVYGLIRSSSSFTESQDFSDEWFGTAVDGSVIGQPEFLNEFVNTDGTAKRLGNGTVSGIPPHSYFSGETGVDVNEVDGKTWLPAATNTDNVTLSASNGVVKWYGDFERSYITYGTSPTNVEERFDSSASAGENRMYTSFFARRATATDSVLDYILYFSTNRSNRTIAFAKLFTTTPGSHLFNNQTGTALRRYDTSSTGRDNQLWQYVSFYQDIASPSGYVYVRNGVLGTAALSSPTTTTGNITTRKIFHHDTSPQIHIANFCVFHEETINNNPGVDWTSPTLFENFFDTATGKPKDIGFDGSLPLGVKPDAMVNGALRLGFSSGVQTLERQTQPDSSVIRLVDSISAEEDIIVDGFE
jgi:hypothetical protein